MLFRTQARNTAKSLLETALAGAGATVSSSRDMPAPSGAMPIVAIYADDSKVGNYGGGIEFKTDCSVTIELRTEAASKDAAEDLCDTLCDLVEQTLYGQATFSFVAAAELNSATYTPSSMAHLYKGLAVSAPGLARGAWIDALDSNAGTIALANAAGPVLFALADGPVEIAVGSFVSLFEQIDKADTFTDYAGAEKKAHVFSATIEIKGHAHERFEPVVTQSLSGLNVYVDSVNIFDPAGDYTGDTPFAAAPAPRASGPDGRAEIAASIDVPQS
jgi:hypothetical protein